MHKFISIILGLTCCTFLFTCLTFAYRYMWWATEVIPDGRIFIAVLGSVAFGGAFFIHYGASHDL